MYIQFENHIVLKIKPQNLLIINGRYAKKHLIHEFAKPKANPQKEIENNNNSIEAENEQQTKMIISKE